MFRQQLARNARLFSTSVRVQNKGPVDAVKDTVKQVDKTVSQTIVAGIEKGGMSNFHRYLSSLATDRLQNNSQVAPRTRPQRALSRPSERQKM